MTYFLDFRTAAVGGHAKAPDLWQGDGATANDLVLVPPADAGLLFAGRHILFATHGFNVTREKGLAALGALDVYLGLPAPSLVVGVLWSGDSWLPLVDYPFEGSVAIATGRYLATYCGTVARRAQSLSFTSHSLGARVMLEAMVNITDRPLRLACLMAGAINNRCLIEEYAAATNAVGQIAVLASDNDDVLKLAFAAGDPFSDLLHDDHSPFEVALGLNGPSAPVDTPVVQPAQITGPVPYGHGDYLPSAGNVLWQQPVDFLKRAFLGQRQTWPP